MGTGPSLTGEQCQRIGERRESGALVLAVNRAHEYLPGCDYVYVADSRALAAWLPDIRQRHGRVPIVTTTRRDGAYRVIGESGEGLHRIPGYVNYGGSGGYQAVNLAYHLRATVICLVGYDYQHTNGQTHAHGNHPQGWANFGSPEERGRLFEPLAADLRTEGVTVVNCTRHTSLTVFERGEL